MRVIRLDRNYGFAGGYNRAISEMTSEYVLLLNSDVEVTEGWWQPLVEVLDGEADVAVVAPKLLADAQRDMFEYAGAAGGFIDYLGYPFCRGRILSVTEIDEGQYDDSREVFWVSGAAFCGKREVYNALGGLCGEFFAHMEEIDLCWRMQLAGWRVVVEPKSCVYHLGGGTLKSTSPRKIYFNHRNNLAMLFRCASPLQRCVVAVVRPLLDMAAAASYIAGGDVKGAKAVFSAWYDFLHWHSRLASERRVIRSDVKSESYNIYKGMIVLRYLFGGRKFKDLL